MISKGVQMLCLLIFISLNAGFVIYYLEFRDYKPVSKDFWNINYKAFYWIDDSLNNVKVGSAER